MRDSGGIASTIATGSRVGCSLPLSCSTLAESNCFIFSSRVVFPTPVGPETMMRELGAASAIASRRRSFASTNKGCATAKSLKYEIRAAGDSDKMLVAPRVVSAPIRTAPRAVHPLQPVPTIKEQQNVVRRDLHDPYAF